jgi:hypothetical protein
MDIREKTEREPDNLQGREKISPSTTLRETRSPTSLAQTSKAGRIVMTKSKLY